MRDELGQLRARELRNRSTDAERRVWYSLRKRNLLGHKFRRQVPIGPYIVDFACLDAALIVELDGSQHEGQRYEDWVRDEYLQARGFRVLRFRNGDALKNTEAVVERIHAVLKSAQSRDAET